jgi:hypothetical protein
MIGEPGGGGHRGQIMFALLETVEHGMDPETGPVLRERDARDLTEHA